LENKRDFVSGWTVNKNEEKKVHMWKDLLIKESKFFFEKKAENYI